jgi:hypothetical protein
VEMLECRKIVRMDAIPGYEFLVLAAWQLTILHLQVTCSQLRHVLSIDIQIRR